MKRVMQMILVFFVFVSTYGCSGMQPFLKGTKAENRFTNEDLKYIQYYIDAPITLDHSSSTSESKITVDNKVEKTRELYKKNILIDKATPGIAVRVDDDEMEIEFADDLIITFVPKESGSTSAYRPIKFNGRQIQDGAQITFRGLDFFIRYGEYQISRQGISDVMHTGEYIPDREPILLFQLTSKLRERVESETIKGKKL